MSYASHDFSKQGATQKAGSGKTPIGATYIIFPRSDIYPDSMKCKKCSEKIGAD